MRSRKKSTSPEPGNGPTKKRRGFSPAFLAISVALHVFLGLAATFWVVQRVQGRKLQFRGGPPAISPNQRVLEHKVSVQKKKNTGGAPAQAKRIAVNGLASKITLPEMPAMAAVSQFVPSRMSGMGGAGFGTGLGFGSGSGMGMGGIGKGGLGLTLFGLQSGADIVIVLDISGSMVLSPKTRVSYDELENEAIRAIRLLGPGTRFNVLTFAKETFAFNKQMVTASMSTKDAAIRWLKTYSPCLILPKGTDQGSADLLLTQTGDRHRGTSSKKALADAFEMRPGNIMFVSDGDPTDSSPSTILQTVQELQQKLPRKVVINTIAYKADSGQAFLKKLAETNGGQFKNIE